MKNLKFALPNKKGNILVFLALLCLTNLRGQSTTDELTARFFEAYTESHTEGINYLFNTNPKLMEGKKSQFDEMVTTVEAISSNLGAYRGHEKIGESSIGDQKKYVSFLLKYDFIPVRLGLNLQKQQDNWVLAGIMFDTEEFEDELHEAAKLYRMPKKVSMEHRGVEKVIAKFFENYRESPEKAVDYVAELNEISGHNEIINVEESKIELSEFSASLGEMKGYEKIDHIQFTESYALTSYLVKSKTNAVRFSFVLYKADAYWRITNFTFDDDLFEELQEAAKVYRLN
ncbi:hypothetical protein [Maribacter sp. 2307ULW6-5]|uniref:hypothetical protein n=1 Tax=Maribacter sp. 2307ULW6-5 TaxID=3386275 RepID=UPI0039BCB419